jgi:hypothetical protein
MTYILAQIVELQLILPNYLLGQPTLGRQLIHYLILRILVTKLPKPTLMVSVRKKLPQICPVYAVSILLLTFPVALKQGIFQGT